MSLHASKYAAPAIVAAVLFGFASTACSTSDRSNASATPDAVTPAAGAQPGGSGTGSAADASSEGREATLAGKACTLLSDSDIKSAVGSDLGFALGPTSRGMQGATAYDACLYTQTKSGVGAAIDIELNTFGGDAPKQLTDQRARDQNQVGGLPGISIKDAAVADGGYELVSTAGEREEDVWFVKGRKLVKISVDKGQPGAALVLAKLVAGKI